MLSLIGKQKTNGTPGTPGTPRTPGPEVTFHGVKSVIRRHRTHT